ncbi:MAG: deoxynucleoside kinase [Pseudomonadota bacterium]
MSYIAIEGPIGVGKTTLARQLANDLGASLLLERPEDNPFLPRFYREPASGALPAQLTFLLQRAGQAEQLQQRDLFADDCIADFLFEKDRLFAQLTLGHADYALYMQVFERLAWDVPPPDCVIYLTAPVQILHERIAIRGRDYETRISGQYLSDLSALYGEYFRNYVVAPVIEIDTSRFDFVNEPSHYAELRKALEKRLPYTQLPAGLLL